MADESIKTFLYISMDESVELFIVWCRAEQSSNGISFACYHGEEVSRINITDLLLSSLLYVQ